MDNTVKVVVLPAATEAAAGLSVTPCDAMIVTTAVAEKPLELAVTATSAGLGTVDGAVYTPALVIDPFEEPLTAHVTVAVPSLLGT